ncbi:HotDog domain-containing protein [Xylaria telfairii]|nr:HotDog domain-containing protein [Xylaria telfairii]
MSTTNSLCLHTALSQLLPGPLQWVPHKELAPGHHLVYFPLNRSGLHLCPDGSDPYHSPHTSFTRRMWAGGSIEKFSQLTLDGRVAFCLERIVDADVRGPAGAEKIFVTVLREYTTLPNFEDAFRSLATHGVRSLSNLIHHLTHNVRSIDLPEYDLKGITEKRTLVFMREPSDEEKKVSLEQEQRIVRVPTEPDYSVTMTPTPTLLFQYSALTYNAHRIHLDRSYCREVEGHRDLLVHGPLSLTLMLTVLQSWLEAGQIIDQIDYRHLAPLYVGQPMRICLKLQKPQGIESEEDPSDEPERKGRNKWDLWVENQDGGLCVKGTAETKFKKRFDIPGIFHVVLRYL